MDQDTRKVEMFPERSLYKLLLIVLKVIPMLLALSAMIGMLLDFLGKDSSIFSFIGGVSLLPLLFLYLASYVFRFCEYHRIIAGSHILTSRGEEPSFLSAPQVQVVSSRTLSCMK